MLDTLLVEASSNTHAAFYLEQFANSTPDEILAHIERAMNSNIPKMPIEDPKYVLEHVYIGLQQTTNERIEKRPSYFYGIEEYLYISDRDNDKVISAKLPKCHTASWEDQLWETAYENVCCNTTVRPIADILFDLSRENDIPMPTELQPILAHVVTNNNRYRGAASILDRCMISKYAKEYGVNKIIMLPSSIHEVLIMPYTGQSIDELTETVKSINCCQVIPEEQLANRAYLIDVADYLNKTTV